MPIFLERGVGVILVLMSRRRGCDVPTFSRPQFRCPGLTGDHLCPCGDRPWESGAEPV